MATWYLMNNVKSGGTQFYAGTLIDDAITPTAPIVAVGGVILASATLGLAVAAPVALSFAREGDFAQAEKIMLEALKVGAGAATEATLASVLAKIIAAPATEAKQTELNTYVAPGTWVPASCIPPGDSAVLSASPCVVRSVIASNRTGDTVYMMLFDAASVPADSTAPRLPFIVIPAESTVQVELGGMTCANGLCWSTTTTFGVKTIGSTTPIVVSAELI